MIFSYYSICITEEKPKRPDYGPAHSIDTSDTVINKLLDNQMLPQDTFANRTILKPTSEINRICSSEEPAAVQAMQNYRCEELSSEELPVVLNNYK